MWAKDVSQFSYLSHKMFQSFGERELITAGVLNLNSKRPTKSVFIYLDYQSKILEINTKALILPLV